MRSPLLKIGPARAITIGVREALVATTFVGALAALAGCNNEYERRSNGNIQSMIASATACPAPALCARKATASGREISLCVPDPAPQAYAVGDIVVTKEAKNHDMLGRIVSRRGAGYEIKFPDDSTFERAPDRISGRVCR